MADCSSTTTADSFSHSALSFPDKTNNSTVTKNSTSFGKHLSFCHLNIRSVLKKSDCGPRLHHLYNFACKENNYDIIALTETHLSNDIDDDELNLEGFNLFRFDRNRHGGGVLLYCRNELHSKLLSPLSNVHLEMLWIENTVDRNKIIFGVCYRPPGQNLQDRTIFLDGLSHVFETIHDKYKKPFILVGDFNDRCFNWTDDHKNSELGLELVNMIDSFNLKQMIMQSTRNDSLLDLIITNCPLHFRETGVADPIDDLDHWPIYGHLTFSYPKKTNYYRTIFNFSNEHMIKLKSNLENVPWSALLVNQDNLNDLVETFTATLKDEINDAIPNKTVLIRTNDKPGMTGRIRRLFRQCHRLHKIATKSKLPLDIEKHRAARRIAKNEWKIAKQNYYDKLYDKMSTSDNKNKYYWKLTKSLYGQNKSHSIPTLSVDGVDYTDDESKTRLLNEYFISQTLNSSIDSIQLSNNVTSETQGPVLSDVAIDPKNILNCLNKLKIGKACGPDGIGNNVLKFCSEALLQPITYITEQSLKSGQFPSSWKRPMLFQFLKIKTTKATFRITAQCPYFHVYPKLSKDRCSTHSMNFASRIIFFPKIIPDLRRKTEPYTN